MKKFRSLAACLISTVLLLGSTAAVAWDGALSGPIATIDVAPGGNFGFRVTLAGYPSMCTAGQTWAYLNDTDSNYKAFIGMLILAKAQGSVVTVYSTQSGGYCHIGYISVG